MSIADDRLVKGFNKLIRFRKIALSGFIALATLNTFQISLSLNDFSGGIATAQERSTTKRELLNRSLITVGSDVYTLLDAHVLLALWNAIAEVPVELKTDFSNRIFLKNNQGLSGIKLVQSYPSDVRRLLFIFFVWDESRRLNLFAPSEKSFSDARGSLQFSNFFETIGKKQGGYWNGLGEAGQQPYLDMVLRARAFYKVRQDLEANQLLGETNWFWHLIPSE